MKCHLPGEKKQGQEKLMSVILFMLVSSGEMSNIVVSFVLLNNC